MIDRFGRKTRTEVKQGSRLTSVPGRELIVQATAHPGIEAVETVELAGIGAVCAREVAARDKSRMGRVKEIMIEDWVSLLDSDEKEPVEVMDGSQNQA